MRVLLLTASYGSGHNAAARTLADAFVRAGAGVRVVDHFRELVHPRFERATRALYYWTLRHAPAAWGAAYGLADRMASTSRLAFGMTQVGTMRLARFLATEKPDAVVTVHATPAVAMSTLVALGRRVPPHTTVVTDFVAHGQWIAPCIDRYCVAAEDVRRQYMARGVPGERLVVTGVPVRPAFETPIDPAEARARLRLSPSLPVVVAMAGSEGRLGRLPEVVETLRSQAQALQAIVVAGKDKVLATELRAAAAGSRIRVIGYTEDIAALMAAADVLVTKAGGMTIAEALAAEVPLVTFGSLQGQERRNERFAARTGIALVAHSRRELRAALDRALGAAAVLEEMRGRIRQVRRPGSAREIVAAVLERDAATAPVEVDAAESPR